MTRSEEELTPVGERTPPEDPRTGNAITSHSELARAGARLPSALPALLPWLFLLIAVPFTIFLSVCTPPFQSPDELSHFDRAWQISRGGLYGGTGGAIDEGIEQFYSHFAQLPFHPRARLAAADELAAAQVHWTGHRDYSLFPNTSTYPPFGYIPQAAAILIGTGFGLSVLHTFLLARLLNAAVALILSTVALSWCRRGKLLMFALLVLPITLSIFGSCSQDAALIAFAALALALISRQIEEGVPLSSHRTILLAAALLVVVVERPPCIPLLLLLLVPGLLPSWQGRPSWLPGLGLAGFLLALTAVWWIAAYSLTRIAGMPQPSGDVNARAQMLHLIRHPGLIPVIVWDTLRRHIVGYVAGMIGNLGWIDTPMPFAYYGAMAAVLLLALIGETAAGGRTSGRAIAVILSAAFLATAAVFFVEYLIWTPVGAHIVDGIQGRYLIPLAMAAGIGLPRLIRREGGYRWAALIVVVAQLLTFLYLPRVIIARYYLR